jgi:hypothetical protein
LPIRQHRKRPAEACHGHCDEHRGVADEKVLALGSLATAGTAACGDLGRLPVLPGQACSYKVGILKFLELRERARAALGRDFDVKTFHRVVLQNGALPLDSLDQVVDDWLRARGRVVPPAQAAPAR